MIRRRTKRLRSTSVREHLQIRSNLRRSRIARVISQLNQRTEGWVREVLSTRGHLCHYRNSQEHKAKRHLKRTMHYTNQRPSIPLWTCLNQNFFNEGGIYAVPGGSFNDNLDKINQWLLIPQLWQEIDSNVTLWKKKQVQGVPTNVCRRSNMLTKTMRFKSMDK